MKMADSELLRRLVRTFGAFDDLNAARRLVGAGDIAPLLVEPWGDFGFAAWRPIEDRTPRETLGDLYRSVPGPCPGLYEQLVLSYRWYQVDVGPVRLLTSLGPGLQGLLDSINEGSEAVHDADPCGVCAIR